MKLLLLTQVLDAEDAVLGFVSRWVTGLAKHAAQVRVVALEVGDTAGLPANVDWCEIGRRGRIRRYWKYRRVLHRALNDDGFDAVLAHMVPRYALVAEGPARRAGAGLFLWYTHKGVDARLRRAVPKVDKVFTASSESLRLEPPNKVVTGHGIDLAHFDQGQRSPASPARLLSVGRMTPAKDALSIVRALGLLRSEGRELTLDLVGGGLAPGDGSYADEVRAEIQRLGLQNSVELHGAEPYRTIPSRFATATCVINASHTGSVDKVVLEAMASRRPVVSCNESIPPVLASLGEEAAGLSFAPGDSGALATAVRGVLDRSPAEQVELGERLRSIVARDHEVDALMARLIRDMTPGGTA